MRETFTEFEQLQEALKRIDMDEVAMPIHNGRIVENKECYCKMQQILGAPEMLKAHPFILNLDPEQLEEDEIERVDRIWNLGVDRGFITPDSDEAKPADEIIVGDVRATEAPPVEDPVPSFSYASQKVDVPCWTVLYSACDKNGDIKTGECYSNSINTRSAKADCYAKLERCGYTNISILAIEAGDPDNCGNDQMLLGKDAPSDKEVEKAEKEAKISQAQADKAIADKTVEELASESKEDKSEDEVEEADTSFDEPKSAHASAVAGNQVETGDFDKKVVAGKTPDEKAAEGASYEELYREFLTAADDYKQIADLQGENSTAAKNAFKEVQGAYEDCYAAVPSHEDEKELLSQVAAYDFKLAADNCTILEGEEVLVDESGNPYVAGMKTADLNGAMKVSSKGSSKPKKAAAPKKAKADEDEKLDEDDEDSSSEKSDEKKEEKSEDKADAEKDASAEDKSGEETSNETSGEEEDSSADSESGDEETSDDASDEDIADDSEDDASDEDASDEESSEKDSENAEKKEEKSDEEASGDASGDEDNVSKEEKSDEGLTDEQKAQFKSEYKKTFKDTMLKCEFEDKAFDDLSIAQKVEFFTKLSKAWKKAEPKDFMSDKEIEQLNKIVIKK